VHVEAPVPLYIPALQREHTLVWNPVPVIYDPLAHDVHMDIPVPVLYFPVGHKKHVETFSPLPVLYDPTAQMKQVEMGFPIPVL
jgi:hypothetical protein